MQCYKATIINIVTLFPEFAQQNNKFIHIPIRLNLSYTMRWIRFKIGIDYISEPMFILISLFGSLYFSLFVQFHSFFNCISSHCLNGQLNWKSLFNGFLHKFCYCSTLVGLSIPVKNSYRTPGYYFATTSWLIHFARTGDTKAAQIDFILSIELRCFQNRWFPFRLRMKAHVLTCGLAKPTWLGMRNDSMHNWIGAFLNWITW